MRLVTSEQIPEVFQALLQNREGVEDAAVATMSLSLDDNLVTESLVKYGLQGDVLAVDNYGHHYGYTPRLTMRGFVPSHYHHPDYFKSRFQGEYVVLNEPQLRIPPFDALSGRSHIKFYRLGNRILSLGGVNCSAYSFYENVDGMVEFESADFADFTRRFVSAKGDLRKNGVGEEIVISDDSTVYVDYGQRRRSLILDGVYFDIEKAGVTSIIESSNYIPFGRIDEALFEHSKNGASVKVYANHPRKFMSHHHSNFSVLAHLMARQRNKTEWQDNDPERFNHLKTLIIKYANGQTVMWIGSHNFNSASVAAGTSEVALRTTNEDLIAEVLEYIQTNLAA